MQRQPDNPQSQVSAPPPGVRPAHPLPARRTRTIDYAQYLETPTHKFGIFSAQERRRRRNRIIAGILIAVAAVVIIWLAVTA